MKKVVLFILLIPLIGCVSLKQNKDYFEEDLNEISEIIYKNVPIGSNVLILDFTDLNGIITHFGRYLSERTYIKMSQNDYFNIVDRNSVELILQEQALQLSGLIDEETITELGKLVGANIFIKGILTEFKDSVDIEISVIDITRGTILGGDNHQISKNQEVSSLIGSIIKSEEQIQRELEIYKQNIMENIENERARRLAALEDEEQRLQTEINRLEADMREKSIIIAEYEEKKQAAQKIDAYIRQLHKEIDQLNANIVTKLKIGMTLDQVKEILGNNNLKKDSSHFSTYISGKYILIFDGAVLTRGVLLGSRSETGNLVNSVTAAQVYGKNIIPF